MKTMTQADITHVYRALKLMRDVIDTSPELLNTDEYEIFLAAWITTNDNLCDNYKELDDE